MYFAGMPGSKSDRTAAATSSGFHTSVTFTRFCSAAWRSSAARPMKSWSNATLRP